MFRNAMNLWHFGAFRVSGTHPHYARQAKCHEFMAFWSESEAAACTIVQKCHEFMAFGAFHVFSIHPHHARQQNAMNLLHFDSISWIQVDNREMLVEMLAFS